MAVGRSFIVALAGALRRQDIPILPLAEALVRLADGDRAPFVVLTFDDGYRDNYETLYPVMLEHHLPVTIFVTTGLVDREMPMWWDAIERLVAGSDRNGNGVRLAAWTDRFRSSGVEEQRALVADIARRFPIVSEARAYDMALSWPMLREMLRSGLLTVGAHTRFHPLLSRLPREAVLAELAGSRRRLEEQLGVAVQHFAYPFGQPHEIGAHGYDAARQAGFAAAFTTDARPLAAHDAESPFRLPRILLSGKAQKSSIALAYMSGAPARLKHIAGAASLRRAGSGRVR